MKAVVLAAGEGKRLNPLTQLRPKPLLPVAGIPLILRTAQALSSIGVEEIVVVTSPTGNQVMDALRGLKDVKVRRAIQESPRGTAHALLAAKSFIQGEERFILVYGDLFFDREMLRGLVTHVSRKFDGGVLAVQQEEAKRFGVIIEEDGVLRRIIEKPEALEGPALINSGVYVLPGETVEVAEGLQPSIRGEYELTDALTRLVERGRRIAAYKHPRGYWLDVGTPANYLEANLLALRELSRQPAPSAATGAIEGSYIAERVRLGRRVTVRSSALMEEAEVGENSILESVVLLENAVVEPGSRLFYTILAEGGKAGRGCSLRGVREKPVVISPGSTAPPYSTAGPGAVF
ncbi:MAG: NDP-sugar synthase [Nitrososphaerota archaeon]|nr:NDP-sugar synthase [Candidatus Calditenuaceae archaeon]MDW8073844.1 NDP-sugar synthase [Nitrososphaerota archaeon]